MTGDSRWFTSFTRSTGDDFITFRDDTQGRIEGSGSIRVNDKFILNDVALVDKLRYNLLSVSQLLDDGYETRFKKNACRVLDSAGELVFGISRVGRIFGAVFSDSFAGSLKCLIASSFDIWLWHRHLGHIGFDHLTRVSGLDLMRGLPKHKAVKDVVCAPCRDGKQVAASHPSLTMVMTDGPRQLLHMDTVGPARVRSVGGK